MWLEQLALWLLGLKSSCCKWPEQKAIVRKASHNPALHVPSADFQNCLSDKKATEAGRRSKERGFDCSSKVEK